MANPQRQLERYERERLTFTECVRVYPRTFGLLTNFLALLAWAIVTGGTWPIVLCSIYGVGLFVLAPDSNVFEGFNWENDRTRARELRERRDAVRKRRPLKHGPQVLAIPHGDFVTIHTWYFNSLGEPQHGVVKFNAEDDAERAKAQDYVAEFKTRDPYPHKTGPSSDAKALAKVINA